jgi:hypothetical protein
MPSLEPSTQPVGAGVAGRLAEPRVVLPGLALAQRVGVGNRELAERVVGRGAGAGGDVDPADRDRGLVAVGIVDVIGLQPQRRGARLDHLLGQQAVALSYAKDDVRVPLLVAQAGPAPISPHSAIAAVIPRMAHPMSAPSVTRDARQSKEPMSVTRCRRACRRLSLSLGPVFCLALF